MLTVVPCGLISAHASPLSSRGLTWDKRWQHNHWIWASKLCQKNDLRGNLRVSIEGGSLHAILWSYTSWPVLGVKRQSFVGCCGHSRLSDRAPKGIKECKYRAYSYSRSANMNKWISLLSSDAPCSCHGLWYWQADCISLNQPALPRVSGLPLFFRMTATLRKKGYFLSKKYSSIPDWMNKSFHFNLLPTTTLSLIKGRPERFHLSHLSLTG